MSPVNQAAYAAELRRVTRRLGLPLDGDLEQAIIEHCRTRLGHWVAAHGKPTTLDSLLELAAACLNVEIVEIRGDTDLQDLRQRIPPQREPVMARLHALLDEHTDGILIKRQRPDPWDKPFLAVVNCRGWHAFRRFFTKWHEIAHRLVDVDGRPPGVVFRRIRVPDLRRDLEEVLVDRVAAALAFYPDIFEPVFREEWARSGRLTFEVVDETRRRVASEASRHATMLACLPCCPEPVYFIRCEMALKREEQRALASPQLPLLTEYVPIPQPKLRVTEVQGTAAALASGIRVHQNMQVPESSLVARAFHDPLMLTCIGRERLEEWQTSTGGPIGYGDVEVEAVRFEDEVWALLRIGAGAVGVGQRKAGHAANRGRGGL